MSDMISNYYVSFFRRGDNVYIREVTEDGGRRNYKVQYKPKLYFATSTPNCNFVTLDGSPLQEVQFESISSARDYVKAYRKPLYGFGRWEYACINELYPQEVQYNMDDLRVVYLDIETWTEGHFSSVANPDQPIVLIQLMYKNVCYVFGTEFYESYKDELVYVRCKDEKDLLKKFVAFFKKIDPDIISDWNGSGFDLPMLYSRMNLLEMGDLFKKMSPFNMVDTYEDIVFGKPQLRVDLKGIQHLDYMNMIRKFDRRRFVNYKLDTVAKQILKRGKVKYKGTMHDLYVRDYNKYVEYGYVDVDLLNGINNETKLLELLVLLGYKSKTNFEDAFYQVRMWDCTFYDYLKNVKSVQVPFAAEVKESLDDSDDSDDEDDRYEGAYVKPVRAGKYRWIMSDDVQSLYPSIMIAWNMSPETLYRAETYALDVEFFVNGQYQAETEKVKMFDYTVAANGAKFTRKFVGFVPEIISAEFEARVAAKNRMTEAKKMVEKLEKQVTSGDNSAETRAEIIRQKSIASIEKIKQEALKVRINSAYGALGNPHFRFYRREIAEGITLTGQVLLKRIDKGINKLLNELSGTTGIDYVIAQDTDSNYIILDNIVKKYVPDGTPTEQIVEFLDRFHKKYIAPEIKRITDEMQSDMNVHQPRLKFVRDVIADVGIFLAKKRYALQVWDVEGVRYQEPDLKIMGIESEKSSTPQFCRNKITEAIKLMMQLNEDDLIDFMEKTKQEYYTLPIEDIAFPRGISELDKWVEIDAKVGDELFVESLNNSIDSTKSGTPIHVKGAINFNNYIKKYDLTSQYFPITNGDKIKFVYLKNPNPSKLNVIAFDDELPKEFNLDKYIDVELQYTKSLLSPIHSIADAIGWKTEKTLGAFF